MKRNKILWADDEIDLLKPHILFLEEKGYDVTPVISGQDAIDSCSEQTFDLIFLDEPTVAVDPQSRGAILDGIKRLNERGATVIYTSHYMEEVEQLCDRIVIMDRGRQVASGTSDELKAMIGTGERIRVEVVDPAPLGEEALEGLRRLEHVRTAAYQDGEVLIECSPGAHNLTDVMRALDAAGATCGRVTSEPPTLNDVFLEITGRALRDEAA